MVLLAIVAGVGSSLLKGLLPVSLVLEDTSSLSIFQVQTRRALIVNTMLTRIDRAHKTALWFLNERECAFIIRQINKDRDDATVEPFNLKKWAASGLDWKIWGFGMSLIFSVRKLTNHASSYLLLFDNRHVSPFAVVSSPRAATTFATLSPQHLRFLLHMLTAPKDTQSPTSFLSY